MAPSPKRRRRGRRPNDPETPTGGDARPEDLLHEVLGREFEDRASEESEGEDLFDERMIEDYQQDEAIDKYESEGIDSSQYDAMTGAQRQAAEEIIREREEATARQARAEAGEGRLPLLLEEEEEARPTTGAPRRLLQRAQARRLRAEAPTEPSGSVVESAAAPSSTPAERTADEGETVRPIVPGMPEIEVLSGPGFDGRAYDPVDLANPTDVPMEEFVEMPAVRAAVVDQFRNFLRTFKVDQGEVAAYYMEKIDRMAKDNKASLEVSFSHMASAIPKVSLLVAEHPASVFRDLDKVALEVTCQSYRHFAESISPAVFVRLLDLPVEDNLRDLRQSQLNQLVRVTGVVTKRTGVYPQLKFASYDCSRCGYRSDPVEQPSTHEKRPGRCNNCQARGPFSLNHMQTVYRNYQRITLQEPPGSVPAGRLPRHKDVILLDDLIDSCRPGEQIVVTGIFTNNFSEALNKETGFPVFRTVIEANHIEKHEDIYAAYRLTEEDRRALTILAKDPLIGQKIIRSIAPSIHGQEDVKTGLALAIFGGEAKELSSKHRIRGDINVLLLGDPSTAKSQFLKYIEQTSPRAVLTTGKGASAVGLTAAVQKDHVTGEYTLEGGALVLADRGVCLIDEFDKMNDQDRTSIHEAMEQQTISISKAGIVASLQARCSVIAAANPLTGRYDASKSLAENVDLTEPILSRFDIQFVCRDIVDPIQDASLAEHVLDSHRYAHPTAHARRKAGTEGADAPQMAGFVADEEFSDPRRLLMRAEECARNPSAIIPQQILKKYLVVARSKHPQLANVDSEKLSSLYVELRKHSNASGGSLITVRHMESIIRMAESHAKMHMRDSVTDDDVNMAIRVALNSFISTQKQQAKRQLARVFRRYIAFRRDNNSMLLHILFELVRTEVRYRQNVNNEALVSSVEIDRKSFEEMARNQNVATVEPFIQSSMFTQNGFSYDSGSRIIRHVFK